MVCGAGLIKRFNAQRQTSLHLREQPSVLLIPGPHLILPYTCTSMACSMCSPENFSLHLTSISAYCSLPGYPRCL